LKNLAYIAKVWGITCLVSPLIYFLSTGFLDFNDIEGFVQLIGISLLFGLVLSFPTMFIIGCIIYYYENLNREKVLYISVAIGVFGTFTTFAIVDIHSFTSISKAMYFPLTYALVLIISLFMFYPKTKNA
jgi:hypothetical protein